MFERLQNIFDFHPRLFSEVMWEWYDNYQLALDESTAYNYKREIIRTVQYFGEDIPFAKVNTALIQEYITFLYEVNHLSSNTVYDAVKPIKFAIDYEISRHKKKKINPFDNVVLPKRMRVEIYPFSEAEMLQLLKQDYVEWVKDGIIIAYHTGMRLGEIYGLKWKDINFDESFIMVQRSQSRAGSKVTLKTTKTRYGVRRIDIDSFLVQFLRERKEKSNSEFIFSMPDGRNRIPWNISKHLQEMCVKAGIPPRSFHTLRHTHATVLLSHGVHPKIVQERLGHSDIKITMEIYSHVTPTIQRAAVEVYENIGTAEAQSAEIVEGVFGHELSVAVI